MKQTDSTLITSCTITWNKGESAHAQGTAKVITRILQTEVQVRFYNAYDGLIGGSIWPMSDQQRKVLFSLLELCLHEWRCDDSSADAKNASYWQLKICTKGKCVKCIEGASEPPPLGEDIKNMLIKVVGDSHCYFY